MLTLQNKIDICHPYTLGGVKNIWLATWYNVDALYAIDNLDIITDMNDLEWLHFESDDKFLAFNEEQDITSPAGRYFKQNITLYFPKLTKEKRTAINQIIKTPLIALIEDYNGRYWLIGQQNPLRSNTYIAKTGVRGDSSDYNLTLLGVSTYLVREISGLYVDNKVTLKTLIIDSPVLELIFDADYKIIYTNSNYKDVLINS